MIKRSLLLLILTSGTLIVMGQYVAPAGNKGAGGGSSSVTFVSICGATGSGATISCNATGTPTSGGKVVVFFETFATVSPSSGNISCSNNGTANTYTFRGGNTTTDYISVVDATLTNVASGMTFSCTTTQTGAAFGGNILVMNATGSTGIDGSPVFNTGASSSANWTTSNVTPSQSGEGIAAVVVNNNASGTMSYNVSAGFSKTSVVDAADANVGPTILAFQGPYASVVALANTFTCTGGCATDTPNMAIVAYK